MRETSQIIHIQLEMKASTIRSLCPAWSNSLKPTLGHPICSTPCPPKAWWVLSPCLPLSLPIWRLSTWISCGKCSRCAWNRSNRPTPNASLTKTSPINKPSIGSCWCHKTTSWHSRSHPSRPRSSSHVISTQMPNNIASISKDNPTSNASCLSLPLEIQSTI